MEDYEKLLDSAYETIKPVEACNRFEILKPEGHFEGTKTIVSNFSQIAGCLRRDPAHLAKFLLGELATSGKVAGERLIFIRKINSARIGEKIAEYVKRYVECPNCKKPDTELIDGDGGKFIRCLACGTRKQVSDIK